MGKEEKGGNTVISLVVGWLAGWLAGQLRGGRWAGDLIADFHYYKGPAPLGWVRYGIFDERDVT